MLTVHEVSRLTGLSVRALHHYDRIGLLRPSAVTDAGYRLYDEAALERLQQILLFRELEFPLKDITAILDSPGFDRKQALAQQITLLEMRREHIEGLLRLAREIQQTGGKTMDFETFDTSRLEAYAAEAKKAWGDTEAYREYEEKSRGRGRAEESGIAEGLMKVIARFHDLRSLPADAPEVQAQVAALQDFITAHYYRCTTPILKGLGQMYAAGGEMTENIDRYGGEGTAVFATEAIACYRGRE
ncbi:MAG: MerR family transcriptional regulator [Clostridia bacterium]|nr:MerR family transcriptional regulator [Clostridia bacterium]